jgi:catechol 2,3-dioxygenase-like lactoylglutathione lyase family enzyme
MSTLDKPILFLATANAARARRFYEGVLGLRCIADEPHTLVFDAGGTMLRIQKVERVQAAPYTALGWAVADIREAVAALHAKGVRFERYDGLRQDEHGIWQTPSGARVAWFKDPDGHTLSLTEWPR